MVSRIQTIKHTQFSKYLREYGVRLSSHVCRAEEDGRMYHIVTVREVTHKGTRYKISGDTDGEPRQVEIDLEDCTMFELEKIGEERYCATAYPKGLERSATYIVFSMKDGK